MNRLISSSTLGSFAFSSAGGRAGALSCLRVLSAWLLIAISAQAASIPTAAQQYQRSLTRVAQAHFGLAAPVALLAAQIHQESAWRANAQSPWAHGLAQFTWPTAQDMARWYPSLGGAQPYDPRWAIQALVLYDKRLLALAENARGAADACEAWAMAFVSYNGGYGWLQREARQCAAAPDCDPHRYWGQIEHFCQRADWACKENRDYPRKIIFKHQPLYLAAGWSQVSICGVSDGR